MSEKTFRIISLGGAASGTVSAVLFAFYWGDAWIFQNLSWSVVTALAQLVNAYVIVTIAALVSRGRSAAFVVAGVSVLVLALGVYTYVDLLPGPAVNDITLLTFPCQRFLAIFSVLVAIVSFVIPHILKVPKVA